MPNKSKSLSPNLIATLWAQGQFGTNSPNTVLNTLWFYFTLMFGLRGVHEHRQMCWGDVVKGKDEQGTYLEFKERKSKTRQDGSLTRAVTPKFYENNSQRSRCIIRIYDFYASKRPVDYSAPENAFYLAANTKFNTSNQAKEQTRFTRGPVGIHKLSTILRRMKSACNLKGNITNHSARKTLVQTLVNKQIPATDIAQLTGHCNLQSINNYSHISTNTHKEMTDLLQPCSPKTTDTTHRDFISTSQPIFDLGLYDEDLSTINFQVLNHN